MQNDSVLSVVCPWSDEQKKCIFNLISSSETNFGQPRRMRLRQSPAAKEVSFSPHRTPPKCDVTRFNFRGRGHPVDWTERGNFRQLSFFCWVKSEREREWDDIQLCFHWCDGDGGQFWDGFSCTLFWSLKSSRKFFFTVMAVMGGCLELIECERLSGLIPFH